MEEGKDKQEPMAGDPSSWRPKQMCHGELTMGFLGLIPSRPGASLLWPVSQIWPWLPLQAQFRQSFATQIYLQTL